MVKDETGDTAGSEHAVCDTLEQKQRAEMRERYLRLMAFLGGKKVQLDMHERTHVSGKFAAVKADQTHYVVNALCTPIGIIGHAILRMNDTIVISTDDIGELSHFKMLMQ